MSDLLVLNAGKSKGRRKMRKFRIKTFRRFKFPKLRMDGIGDFGIRRIPKYRPMSISAVPWTKGTGAYNWFKSRTKPLMKTYMSRIWRTYKRGKWGRNRRSMPIIPTYSRPSSIPMLPSGVHLGLGASDDLGLMRMTDGWLPAVNILGLGSMGAGLVSVFYVPKLQFIPDMFKSGIGRIGLQLGTGFVGNAVLSKIVKRPDMGYHFFTGALAGTIIDALNTYVFKGAIQLSSSGGSGMGVYFDRPASVSDGGIGVYVDKNELSSSDDEDDDA